MADCLEIATTPCGFIVIRTPDGGIPHQIAYFNQLDYGSAVEHVHYTAAEMGAEAIEVEEGIFTLHPIDNPSNVLTHEWTPER